MGRNGIYTSPIIRGLHFFSEQQFRHFSLISKFIALRVPLLLKACTAYPPAEVNFDILCGWFCSIYRFLPRVCWLFKLTNLENRVRFVHVFRLFNDMKLILNETVISALKCKVQSILFSSQHNLHNGKENSLFFRLYVLCLVPLAVELP